MLLLVYALVFAYYLRSGIDDYAAFLACGLLPWIWFSSAVIEGTSSIVEGSNLVNKALFPAEVLPLVAVASNLVHFLLGLPILAGFLIFYNKGLSSLLGLLPLLLLVQLVLTTALVLLFATLNVFYRDLKHIIGNLLTLWFFLSPIVYDVSQVPKSFAWTLEINPMAHLIRGYQAIFYYHALPPHYLPRLLLVLLLSLGFLVLSHRIFDGAKDEFVEQI
jgi:ABC-type polysaccharide/polyol phosphate export permease